MTRTLQLDVTLNTLSTPNINNIAHHAYGAVLLYKMSTFPNTFSMARSFWEWVYATVSTVRLVLLQRAPSSLPPS